MTISSYEIRALEASVADGIASDDEDTCAAASEALTVLADEADASAADLERLRRAIYDASLL